MYDLRRGVKQLEISDEHTFSNTSEGEKKVVDADIIGSNSDNLDFLDNKNSSNTKNKNKNINSGVDTNADNKPEEEEEEKIDDYLEIYQNGKILDEKFAKEIREMKKYRGGPLEPEWKWVEDISIVYTWVNGSDLNHLDLKSKYNGGNRNIDNRDRSVDELRYSLRSLEKYLPWHKGTIYIVSPNQTPVWLNTNSRVKVINQDDLLPPNVAPTFNTFTIELFLDKIPGLTERFIQLNDDYFFRTYTHPSFFFTSKTFYPKFYQTNKTVGGTRGRALEISRMENAGMIRKFQGSVFNTNHAIREAFGYKNKMKWLDHSPYNWYRDLFEPARQLFKSQVQDTISHKFRHPLDLVPPYAMEFYTYYATKNVKYPEEVGGNGLARFSAPVKLPESSTIKDFSCEIVPQEVRKEVIRFGSVYNNITRNEIFFNEIVNSNILMFNLNDDYRSREAGLQLLNFMRKQYPKMSSFELFDAEVDETEIRQEIENAKERSKNKDNKVVEQKVEEPVDDTSPREQEEIDFLLKYKGEPLDPEWKWAEDMSFVYSWVNGSDPNHMELKSKYNGGEKKVDNRDRSMDELRYSIRSFEKYLPWHKGMIYIVTPNQVPVWLDTNNPRIKVINQDDIIPSEANPTFNSFLVEMYLDKIPGISERFVYLNDDYFFRTYTHPRFFFTAKNFAPKFYFNKRVPFGTKKALEMNKGRNKLNMIRRFQSAVFYTNGIVKEAFGNSVNLRWLDHSPYSWYRDLFEPARQLYRKYVKQSLTHRFRDSYDIIPTYSFQAYIMYAASVPNYPEFVGGDGTSRESAPARLNPERTIKNYSYDIVSPNVRAKTIKFGSIFDKLEKNEKLFNFIRNSTVLLYNLNDDYKSEEAAQSLVNFMVSMYPTPSKFELSEEAIKERLAAGFDGSIANSNLGLSNQDDDNTYENPQNVDDGDEILREEAAAEAKNAQGNNVMEDNVNDVMEVIDSMNLMGGEQVGLPNEKNGINVDDQADADADADDNAVNENENGGDGNIDTTKADNKDSTKQDTQNFRVAEDPGRNDRQGEKESIEGKPTKYSTNNHELDLLLNYDGGELEPEWEWAKNMSIVYTWIDGSDNNHLDLKAKYNGGNRKVNNRDRSVGELRYSLRSLEKYLPWHKGTIYIVSPNQVPDFLDINHPRIKVINQDDLFPPHVSPTFNSFVVEMYLDKIPGITERFVQLNDDYFFNNYCHPSFFFSEKGFYPKFYRTSRKVRSVRKTSEVIAKMANANMIRKFHGSVYNTNDAVKQAFGQGAVIRWLDHSPYCWYRDLYEPARQVYEKQVKETLIHKFRHPLDLVPTYAFQAFTEYATKNKEFPQKVGGLGKAKYMAPLSLNPNRTITDYSFELVPQVIRRKVIKFGSILNNVEKNRRLFKKIVGSTIIMYNLNDDYQKKEALYQLIDFMKTQYPEPSSFEKKEGTESDSSADVEASKNIDVNAKIIGDSATQNTNENGEAVNDDGASNANTNEDDANTMANASSMASLPNNLSDRERQELNTILNYHGEELSEEWKWAEDLSFVYIWNNRTDPEYINNRNQYTNEKVGIVERKYDELRYSLRSLDKYLPWHKGKIFIVTPGQTPSWLDASHSRIEIINQDDILPLEAIPTFNIFVLEMYLDRIPGISERFVYMNNNHYFKTYTHPEFFFNREFAPKYYLTRHVTDDHRKAFEMARNKKLKNYRKYQSSLYYTNGIVKEAFGASISIRYTDRVAYPWYRDLFEPARKIFKNYVSETVKHKFIEPLDIIPIFAIQSFNIYGAANPFFPEIIGGDGKAKELAPLTLSPDRTIDYYPYDIVSPGVRENTMKTTALTKNHNKNREGLQSIENNPGVFMSIKLQGEESNYYDELMEFMGPRFPEKSSFEKK
ncbi:hypothetical protein PIROE2DRAFT_7577 [Piromyces sp. E2]|nr:hypothetical protein PIROE2DRAFT_7577 [Piromyces sp. E2]|eukprot:OUM65460.1 hypothetical protein PIROE2DRAFT_7577 [Piromyces sp. E2]